MAGGGSEHVCAPAGEGEEVVREWGKALKLTRRPAGVRIGWGVVSGGVARAELNPRLGAVIPAG